MYDYSTDMGLETNVSDQQSVQSGLDPSGDTSNVIGLMDLEYNLKPGFVTNYIKSLLKTNMVRDIQRDRSGQITGVTAVDNPYSPQGIYGGLVGNNPSTGIMGLVGQALGPPGFSAIPGLIGGITGQEVTSYTGYNPDGDKETDGSNFSSGGDSIDPNENDEGIKNIIYKPRTSDVLRAYLENMDNYFELTPGKYLRRVI